MREKNKKKSAKSRITRKKKCKLFRYKTLKKAIDEDIRNIPLAGNTSRFLRWLVERYIAKNAE